MSAHKQNREGNNPVWVASSADENDGCIFRTFSGMSTGLLAGALLGSVKANFEDTPVSRNRDFLKVPRAMGAMGATLAFATGAFAATECVAESMRMKKDFWNGVLGGFAAGAVTGAKASSMGVAVGSGFAFAAVSAFFDLNGGKLYGSKGIVDDGETLPPTLFPYPKQSPSGTH